MQINSSVEERTGETIGVSPELIHLGIRPQNHIEGFAGRLFSPAGVSLLSSAAGVVPARGAVASPFPERILSDVQPAVNISNG